MSVSIPVATICFISCHGAPADHFATYAKVLTEQQFDVQIHAATGAALDKLRARGIAVKSSFDLKNLNSEEKDNLAKEIAKVCSTASLVLTDVGDEFDIKIQKALATYAAKVPRLAYYDNPEPLVPGNYSSIAAEVMRAAEGILFANEALAHAKIYSKKNEEIDFAGKPRLGIGYYPISQAEKVAEQRRTDHDSRRSEFLRRKGIEDKGQKIWVYFGGNNKDYFEEAFPAFLSFLSQASEITDLSNIVVIIQQHPSAKVENQDGQQVSAWLAEHSQKAQGPKSSYQIFPLTMRK
ncbi:hypothetical protein [Parachlamydia sp. AcF125]|uniref:hypothetical protein n=1 Tax=Parachlamydia sp. AcF125 TaxID=2795736 RepID=UPI001BC9FEB0|nr:hypothetical protein [Parachlamydia sp. AcF125]